MNTFTPADVKALLQEPGKPCVSIYMPTEPGGSEQDFILWKDLLKQAEERLALFERLGATDRICTGPEEVVEAAHLGKLEILFVPRNRELWGTLDPGSGVVMLRDRPVTGDEDLLNVAAAHAFASGGTVY